jgi:hypothetical protein
MGFGVLESASRVRMCSTQARHKIIEFEEIEDE